MPLVLLGKGLVLRVFFRLKNRGSIGALGTFCVAIRGRCCFGKDAQVAASQCASGGLVQQPVWGDMGTENPSGLLGLKI